MFGAFWPSALAIALALAINAALRLLGKRGAPGMLGAASAKRVATARLLLAIFVVVIALTVLSTSAIGLAQPLRWVLWGVGALCAAPWLANATAGLWLVSPLGKASPGDTIVACGQSGRIVGYGMTRLELETETGWRAYLPYIAVAFRPILMNDASRPRGMEFVFQAPDWTQEKVHFLRQAAVLAPYRDISSPLSVERDAGVVIVHLSLAHPDAEQQMRYYLETALTRYDAGGEVSASDGELGD